MTLDVHLEGFSLPHVITDLITCLGDRPNTNLALGVTIYESAQRTCLGVYSTHADDILTKYGKCGIKLTLIR